MKTTLITIAAATVALAACASSTTEEMKERECFKTPGGGAVEIDCIRHGSIAISYDGYSIQIDPVVEMDGETVDYSGYAKADAIFVTHEHYDHLCEKAIGILSKETTRVFANAASCETAVNRTALRNGDSGLLTDKIRFAAVPAYNTTEGRDKFHPKERGNGYLFDIDGLVIYVAGDTETIPEMAELPSIFGKVDVAFLPVNQPYTMTVAQCAEAALMIRPAVLIPYHYSATDLASLPGMVAESGIEVRIHESLR